MHKKTYVKKLYKILDKNSLHKYNDGHSKKIFNPKKTMINKNITKIRKKEGLSQDFMAKQLDISRPTYIQIEKGERDVSVKEAQKLADLFDISLYELIESKDKQKPKSKKRIIKKKDIPGIRISVPQKNIEKFKEVLLYILEKVGAKPNVGETVIYKLLYFIDFDFYEKYEEQLMGATYIKNHHGPTPLEFKKVVQEMQKNGEIEIVKSKYFQYNQRKYLPLRKANLFKINAAEKELIDDVLARLSNKTAKELSEYSHKDIPWSVHKMGEQISYEMALYRDDEYSVRDDYDEL